jgi:hypothetical protein
MDYCTQPTKTLHTLKYVGSPDSQGFRSENAHAISIRIRIRNGNFFIPGSILTDSVRIVSCWWCINWGDCATASLIYPRR